MTDMVEWLRVRLNAAEALAAVAQDRGALATWSAFWDPVTVLRMVKADRKLLELHKPYSSVDYQRYACSECDLTYPWPCPTIKIRAQAWGWTGETE